MALTKIGTDGVKDDAITSDKVANSINSAIAANTAKTQTTINNNADNRVITGSGTANTLNGESNVVINAGKLGIGLTSPAAPIHTHTGNATNYRAFSNTACGGSTGSDGFLLGIDSNANVNIWNFENTFMNFATNGGERMRIDASGRLLLGLTSGTSALLQVDEGAQVFGAANDGNSSCLTMDYASGTGRIMGHGSSGGNLAFFTNASGSGVTERMRIDTSGKVLIGTTTPAPYSTRLLTVGDTSFDDTALEIRSSSSTGRIYFTDSSSSGVGAYQGELTYEHLNGANRMHTKIGGTTKISVTTDGLTFNGDTAAANALDDYEEGTYVPVVKNHASGSAFSYSSDYELRSPHTSGATNTVAYTKIGNRVYLSFSIFFNTSGNSRVNISLPFAIRNDDYQCAGHCGYFSIANSHGVTFIGQGLSNIDLMENDSNGGHPNLSYTASSEIYINFHYETN